LAQDGASAYHQREPKTHLRAMMATRYASATSLAHTPSHSQLMAGMPQRIIPSPTAAQQQQPVTPSSTATSPSGGPAALTTAARTVPPAVPAQIGAPHAAQAARIPQGVHSWTPQAVVPAEGLQVEIHRRQAAEARVRELEALVLRLRQRVSVLERKRSGSARATGDHGKHVDDAFLGDEDAQVEDPIDRAICEYLDRNQDFPVSIQKVAPNYYVFGDRGTVYVTQRGEHIVVRVGGGFKSLQVFMDERALMVTRDNATALAEKTQQGQSAAVAA